MEKEYVKKGVKKERVDFIDYLDTLKTDEEENQESSMAVAKLQARPPYMCPTLRRQLEEKRKHPLALRLMLSTLQKHIRFLT